MSWRVLITANAFLKSGEEAQRPLQEAGFEIIIPPKAGPLKEKELLTILEGIDIVIASSDAYTSKVLENAKRLKVISRWGVGVDSIDLAAATRYGVIVTNTPGLTTTAVADYTFGLILALARRIPEGDALVKSGGWREIRGVDVWRKCLGIIGLGSIGKGVAKRASGFEMQIVAYDIVQDEDFARSYNVKYVPLETLLAQADFVTLHANLTDQNRGMIGATELELMKPTAYLINTARGALVDEAALIEALKKKKIAGAALDAYVVEPLPIDHPLRSFPNCITMPHSGSQSVETAQVINVAVIENIMQIAQGKRPISVVNTDVYEQSALRIKRKT